MKTFTVQYETVVDGEPVPVARFDTAHGFPHIDILDRRGQVIDKTRLVNQPTLGTALTFAQQEFQNFWPRFRETFFKDQS